MSKSLDYLANINQVNLLIGTVNVRLGAAHTKSNDLSVRVLALELLEERNGAAFTESAEGKIAEVFLGGLLEATLKPTLEGLLLPATTSVATLEGDLGVVGDILRELLIHNFVCFVSIKDGAESH